MKYAKTCLTKANKSHAQTAPRWFTESRDIRRASGYLKSFDTLGLKDFTVATKLNSGMDVASKLEYIHNSFDDDDIDHDDSDHLQCMAAASMRHIVESLQGRITSKNTLTKSIVDDRDLVLFKKGSTVKAVIKDLLLRANNVSDSYPAKAFNEALNMLSGPKGKSRKVVFSTNPWDILTMSMRGIDSCMEWNSSHCRCLIGSVLDPYVGVIYVTNEQKTAYGSHMNFRSVVRLVKQKNDPAIAPKFRLFVEGAYPNDLDDDADRTVTEMFRSVLAKRIKNNTRIAGVVKENEDSYKYYVPFTTETRNMNPEHRTYFDSDVRYGD